MQHPILSNLLEKLHDRLQQIYGDRLQIILYTLKQEKPLNRIQTFVSYGEN